MRELLFKAKRTDNKEWAEGFYLEIDSISYILPKGKHMRDIVQVDPETVCRYTELKDKNWTKIYEGDKLSDEFGDSGIVKYGEFNCGCCYDVFGFIIVGIDGLSKCDKDLIVIGNIHDKEE